MSTVLCRGATLRWLTVAFIVVYLKLYDLTSSSWRTPSHSLVTSFHPVSPLLSFFFVILRFQFLSLLLFHAVLFAVTHLFPLLSQHLLLTALYPSYPPYMCFFSSAYTHPIRTFTSLSRLISITVSSLRLCHSLLTLLCNVSCCLFLFFPPTSPPVLDSAGGTATFIQ